MNAEVRLYYKGRIDWDTIYFKAITETDLVNKGCEIAKKNKADFHSSGMATEMAFPPKSNRDISLGKFGGGFEVQIAGVKAAEGINDYA